MHNALRDDGKYGYITRQRPMLFSLASRWLMLIRNPPAASAEWVGRRWPTFIKANPTASCPPSKSSLKRSSTGITSAKIALYARE
ncbi:hypothetical protein M0804_000796 [Polistes exclamans]|nr:hypothetical protein M0804_000796 [Polistes exclamans]